jgi:hypothetical protein
MKKVLLVLCIGVGAYQGFAYIKERRARQAYLAFVASEPKNRAASNAGFVDAVQPDGINPMEVTVFFPVNCPLETGRRGRALIDRLKSANIPVSASASARTSIKAATREEFEAKKASITKIMGGELPIVFYKGRAKNNPSFEDVLLEYRTAQ